MGEKYKDLSSKDDKIIEKMFELSDIGDTLVNAKKSLVLSSLGLIPTDQLEKAKVIALKSEPHKSGEIESFFNKIMNAENKPPESIKIDAQMLQTFMDVHREEREKVSQESKELDRKMEKLLSEIPTLLTKEDM